MKKQSQRGKESVPVHTPQGARMWAQVWMSSVHWQVNLSQFTQRYLQSTCYGSAMLLSTSDRTVNKTDKNVCLSTKG